MPDIEKVIKALEECAKYDYVCSRCDYKPDEDVTDCCSNLMIDALKLLVTQRETIDELISADKALKQIVHCKDCKNYKLLFDYKDNVPYFCTRFGDYFTSDWFCADGDKRNE